MQKLVRHTFKPWKAADGYTQSLLCKYLQCQRQFYFRTQVGLSKNGNLPMTLGSLGHAAIELFRKGKSWKTALTDFPFPAYLKQGEIEWAKAVIGAIMPHYVTMYKKEHRTAWKPEVLINTEFGGHLLRGKVDGVGTRIQGDTAIIETKFKSRISDDKIDNLLAMDFQSMFYLVALAQQQERELDTVVYDVVRYPAFTQKSPAQVYKELSAEIARNPEYYFRRWVTTYQPEDIEVFIGELRYLLDEIAGQQWSMSIRRHRGIRNLTACNFCDYLTKCSTGIDKALKVRPLFEELK
jgi:hypothetical protein